VTLGFGAITQSQLPSVHNIVGQAPLLKDSADSSNVKNGSISGSNLTNPFRYTGTYFYAVNGVYSGTVTGATSKFGSATNYMSTDPYGRYIATGDSAVAWGELFVTPSAVRVNPVNTKPDYGTWLFPGQTYSFDASSAESLYFHVEVPHNHRTGTALHAHVHWAPSTTHTGDCAWKIAWMVQDVNDTFAFTAGDTLSVRDAGDGTANKHQYVELGEISMAGVSGVSAVLSGVLIRDAAMASDSFTGEAYYLDLGFHYQIDSFGSRWETLK
jgi:hypothetical protein